MTSTKVVCGGEILKQYVARAYNVASKNSGDGVNAGIRLKYDGESLCVHGTNMDVYYEGKFSATTDSIFKAEGEVRSAVVSATVFHKIMQAYKRGEMTLTLKETAVELLTADGCEYSLPIHVDAADFLEISWPTGSSGTVPTVLLKAALERAYPCLSQNPSQNYAITGAKLAAHADGFSITATNTIALLRVRIPTTITGDEIAVVLPRAGVAAFETFHEEYITLTVAKEGVVARTPSEAIRVLPIAQDYPAADRLIDALEYRTTTTMTSGDLLDGVKRVHPVLSGADPVRFVVKSEKKLELVGAAQGRGRARIEVACQTDCPVGTEMLFSPDFLIAFLRPVLGGAAKVLTWRICAALSNNSVPSVFSVADDILRFEYLQLPHSE